MPELPVLNGREAVATFQRGGYILEDVRGSHHVLVHTVTGRRISVPVHSGRDMKRGTLRGIVRDAGLTVEEFVELLK